MKMNGFFFKVAFCVLFLQLGMMGSFGQVQPRSFSVELSAVIQPSPAQITLNWRPDSRAVSYQVSRKGIAQTSWTVLADNLPSSQTSWPDTGVSMGVAYEYRVIRNASDFKAYGYIVAGNNIPFPDFRGNAILVIESGLASSIPAAIDNWANDLKGDGWKVSRVIVSSSDSPQSVKNQIRAIYNQAPQVRTSVALFGAIPVPYSGNIFPDGHPNHQGAWPADTFYGDMDGTWTDTSVNSVVAERDVNWNVPGDGKFDQSQIPADIKLEVGRIDLSNLTAFQKNSPARSETEMHKQYLDKATAWRNGRTSVNRKGIIYDMFGSDKGEDPVANSGWRNFAALMGSSTTEEAAFDHYVSMTTADSYLWSYACGGGQYFTLYGIGDSNVFATNDLRVVFTMWLGSYLGDWNNENNWMRSSLGGRTYTLTASYAGAPPAFLHHMGAGETIGYNTKLTQNNMGLYMGTNQGAREVHISLLGDPMLRMHPFIPASALQAQTVSDGVKLTWQNSPDGAVVGNVVYRKDNGGIFQRISGANPITGSTYTDQVAAGGYEYMVRAVKLESTPGGTYFNPSQGIFVTGTSNGVSAQPPYFASMKRVNSDLQLEVAGSAGQTFNYSYSLNLQSWTPLGGGTIGATNFVIIETNYLQYPKRFLKLTP
jgi:hypothetical protein